MLSLHIQLWVHVVLTPIDMISKQNRTRDSRNSHSQVTCKSYFFNCLCPRIAIVVALTPYCNIRITFNHFFMTNIHFYSSLLLFLVNSFVSSSVVSCLVTEVTEDYCSFLAGIRNWCPTMWCWWSHTRSYGIVWSWTWWKNVPRFDPHVFQNWVYLCVSVKVGATDKTIKFKLVYWKLEIFHILWTSRSYIQTLQF